ncbi:Innexin [Aphelenchoides besseyi]|nr:Innexin [Aphelenchoides besseyi]KAI6200521.1 Innexin [Aphelenchoides besseyi]
MNLLGSAITSIKPRLDDTVVDRLNYYYSTVIIMVMSITLTARQYVGQPLQCWVPSEFSKAWDYEHVLGNSTLRITVLSTTHFGFLPKKRFHAEWMSGKSQSYKQFTGVLNFRVSRQLLYYQWVPFIMALQAGFFYLPVIFWGIHTIVRKTNTGSGINIQNIIRMVRDTDKSDKVERSKAVSTICNLLKDALRLRDVRKMQVNRFDHYFKLGLLDGQYVANMYTITKFLYLLNLIGQFLMMNQFLDQNNHAWGADILRDIINGKDWETSGNFPRVAFCDFTIRTMANVKRYTIQCVLMLNMFNEKIFLFLYWWLIFVGIITFVDIIRWTADLRFETRRLHYVRKFLRLSDSDFGRFQEFCSRVISADGIFVLEMISIQANELYTQEVLDRLWDNFLNDSDFHCVIASSSKRKNQPHMSSESSSLHSHLLHTTLIPKGQTI